MSALAVLQSQDAAMGFGNLPAQRQTDARTFRFRGEERNEKIGRVRKAWPVIFDGDFDISSHLPPADPDATARFQRSISRIADQIDEELIQLIGVRLHGYGWTRLDGN